jgi:FAD/FMN-containing dehydrogenase
MTSTVAVHDLFAPLLGNRIVTDDERKRRYEIPERGEPGHSPGVLLPVSEAEVGAILRLCNQHRLALVISAGRTGLVEAQRPQGELVMSLERLQRPLYFRLADGRGFDFAAEATADDARAALLHWWRAHGAPSLQGASLIVQAGMSVDAVNELLEPLDLMWPMEMGSSSAASVGGCVANASAGANAVCYGTAAQMAEWASGFWGDGSEAGPCMAPPRLSPPADTLAIDSSRIDPALGLIGSQGTLGIVTRVALRCYARPAAREAVLLPVGGMPEAMRVLTAAQQDFAGDIEEFEFIGRGAMNLLRMHLGSAFRLPFEEDPDAPYYVLLQLKSADTQADLAGRLYSFLADKLAWPEAHIGYAPLAMLKKLRHSITESSNARMRALGGGRLSFDTATPVSVFGDYLAELERAVRALAPGIEFVAFGHAGVGGAHIHLLGDSAQPLASRTQELVRTVFDVTLRYGGTFSAEHGIGPKWGTEFQQRAPRPVREALRAAKDRHDPARVLNPRSFAIPHF